MSCHVMSCHVMSCHVMSCHVMSCHVMSCHVMSCHVMSCHVMSCHVMSCHVMSCHVMSCQAPEQGMNFTLTAPEQGINVKFSFPEQGSKLEILVAHTHHFLRKFPPTEFCQGSFEVTLIRQCLNDRSMLFVSTIGIFTACRNSPKQSLQMTMNSVY